MHLACSEAFYRNNVTAELASSRASTEARGRMLEVLARFEAADRGEGDGNGAAAADNGSWNQLGIGLREAAGNDDEYSDEGSGNDGEPPPNLDGLDASELLALLTPDERAEFDAALAAGRVPAPLLGASTSGAALEYGDDAAAGPSDDDDNDDPLIARPWWLPARPTSANPPAPASPQHAQDPAPPPATEDAEDSALGSSAATAAAAAWRLRANAVELVLAYVVAWRHTNGELAAHGGGAAAWAAAATLCEPAHTVFGSVAEAAEAVVARAALLPSLGYDASRASRHLADAAALLAGGPDAVAAAFTDLAAALDSTASDGGTAGTRTASRVEAPGSAGPSVRQARAAARKLRFYAGVYGGGGGGGGEAASSTAAAAAALERAREELVEAAARRAGEAAAEARLERRVAAARADGAFRRATATTLVEEV
ncbi:hypothetical protein HK405_013336 [Cladochytrium tenue]|nr:hypothetical protein HK405_013336 [Cladochytrium tenue]